MSVQTYNIRRRSSWSVFLACIVAVLTLSACTQHTDEISDTEKVYVRNLISEAKSNADSLQALNANKQPTDINVPEGEYTVVVDNGKVDVNGLGSITGQKATVGGQQAMVIYRK